MKTTLKTTVMTEEVSDGQFEGDRKTGKVRCNAKGKKSSATRKLGVERFKFADAASVNVYQGEETHNGR